MCIRDRYIRASLPGFGKLTLEHLRRADEWIWVRLAELTRDGAGCFPCDAALRSVLASPELALVNLRLVLCQRVPCYSLRPLRQKMDFPGLALRRHPTSQLRDAGLRPQRAVW
eukprot:2990140-Amphidinium_carterae.1